MSDSSTEEAEVKTAEVMETAEVKTVSEPNDSKTVPVKAVTEERAKKRAAQAEVERLEAEKARVQGIDEATLDSIVAQAKAAVDEQLKPERERREAAERENALLRLRMDQGLNDEQAEKVMTLQAEKQLEPNQALAILRAEDPANFPPQVTPQMFGGLSPSGNSMARAQPNERNYLKESHELREKGDKEGAQRAMAMEFERRFKRQFHRP